jgi:hypothetical protein
MNRAFSVFAGATLALVLAACGGGGGLPPPPAGPQATGTVNSASVLSISGRSVGAALQSGTFGSITDFVGLTGLVAGNSPRLSSGYSGKPVDWYVNTHVPVGPETTECAVGGTVTVSGDIASPLTVTVGDFLDYEWDNCDDGFGEVISGLIGMTFTDFDGNLLAGQILLGVSIVVENFQVSDISGVDVANGDMSLTIDSRSQPMTVVETIGSSLSVANGNVTDTLTDFATTVTEDTSMFPPNYTTDATGAVSSTLFNGFVTYNMPIPYESTGDEYPYTGEMVVFGTNNSRARIIAMSEVDVRIEADYDGDGASDATIDTTWAALVED